jgi:hypothetical protein
MTIIPLENPDVRATAKLVKRVFPLPKPSRRFDLLGLYQPRQRLGPLDHGPIRH